MREEEVTGEEGAQTFHLTELERAVERLKGRYLRGYPVKDEAMRQLLAFAQSDVSTLSAGDWLNWQYELVAFALLGEPMSESPHEVLPRLKLSIPTLPTKEQVEDLRTLAREHINDIIDTGRTVFKPDRVDIEVTVLGPIGPVAKRLMKAANHREVARVYRSYIFRSPDAAFQHALSALLIHTGDRLRQCEECTKIFLADRIDQVFCSKTCQSRTTTRRWRESHPNRYRKGAQSGKQGRASSKKGGLRHGTKGR